jgi:hypothetical protein
MIERAEGYLGCNNVDPRYCSPSVVYPYIVIKNNEPYSIRLNRLLAKQTSISVYRQGLNQYADLPLSDIVLPPGQTACFGSSLMPAQPACNNTILLSYYINSGSFHNLLNGLNQSGFTCARSSDDPNATVAGSFTFDHFAIEYSANIGGSSVIKRADFGDYKANCVGTFEFYQY